MNFTCHRCGYETDAQFEPGSGLDVPVPKARINDLNMCCNCAQVHQLREEGWEAMSPGEIRGLHPDNQRMIAHVERAIRKAIPLDLALDQKLRKQGI
jgi:hypothetical protein